MCQVLKISESGYYRWLRNQGKQTGRQLLLVKIKEIVNEHPDNQNYGVDRILLALLQKGIQVSRRTVYRTMQEGGMLHKKRTPRGITKATTEVQEQENLIKRDFHADRPMQKLLTDISEIQCVDGKLYVSPVLDCFSGEILALEMRDNMKKELCIDTVRQLQAQYGKLLQGIILHSDRGSQYTSNTVSGSPRTPPKRRAALDFLRSATFHSANPAHHHRISDFGEFLTAHILTIPFHFFNVCPKSVGISDAVKCVILDVT